MAEVLFYHLRLHLKLQQSSASMSAMRLHSHPEFALGWLRL